MKKSLLCLAIICVGISIASNATPLKAKVNVFDSSLPCDTDLHITTNSNTIKSIEQYAAQISCSNPSINMCVVVDIDNTLITNDPNFGGEAWGSWQDYLAANDPNNKNLITNWLENSDIYSIVYNIRFMIDYHPVETITASTISNLQQLYPTIALTSRGFSGLTTTARQLSTNGINLATNPIGDKQFDNSFLQLNADRSDLKMYYNGVYYAAGDSKGQTLLDLVNYYRNKMNQPDLCKALVILDDTQSKIDDISTKLQGNIGYVGITYTALPVANDPSNWHPDLWNAQSKEISNTISNLNR